MSRLNGLELQLVAACAAVLLIGALFGKADGWAAWARASAGWTPSWIPPWLTRDGIPFTEAFLVVLLVATPMLGVLLGGLFFVGMGLGVFGLIGRHRGEECSCFGDIASTRLGPLLGLRNIGTGVLLILVGVTSPHATGGQLEMALLLAAMLSAVALLTLRHLFRMAAAADWMRQEMAV